MQESSKQNKSLFRARINNSTMHFLSLLKMGIKQSFQHMWNTNLDILNKPLDLMLLQSVLHRLKKTVLHLHMLLIEGNYTKFDFWSSSRSQALPFFPGVPEVSIRVFLFQPWFFSVLLGNQNPTAVPASADPCFTAKQLSTARALHSLEIIFIKLYNRLK